MSKSEMKTSKKLSVYIHVPFCVSKCSYCDFISFAGMNSIVPSYFEALKREIEGKLHVINSKEKYKCTSIFFGGGTPSYVESEYIKAVVESIKSKISLCEDCEITIEANPGTITDEKLYAYKEAGINRMSLGLQAWQNRLLEYMGRAHNITQFIDNIEKIKRIGFKNINVDLIYGLPTQTFEEWQVTLNEVIKLGINHISCYSLKLEEGTSWYEKHLKKELPEIDEDLERKMYHYAQDFFAQKGIQQYEISNFSKAGWECKHNLVYWTLEEYIGFGAGAHSYMEQTRYSNISELEQYIDNIQNGKEITVDKTYIPNEESIAEFMILGLRLNKGVSFIEFQNNFKLNLIDFFAEQIERLVKQDLIQLNDKTISLTRKGLDFANQVFMEFLNC